MFQKSGRNVGKTSENRMNTGFFCPTMTKKIGSNVGEIGRQNGVTELPIRFDK